MTRQTQMAEMKKRYEERIPEEIRSDAAPLFLEREKALLAIRHYGTAALTAAEAEKDKATLTKRIGEIGDALMEMGKEFLEENGDRAFWMEVINTHGLFALSEEEAAKVRAICDEKNKQAAGDARAGPKRRSASRGKAADAATAAAVDTQTAPSPKADAVPTATENPPPPGNTEDDLDAEIASLEKDLADANAQNAQREKELAEQEKKRVDQEKAKKKADLRAQLEAAKARGLTLEQRALASRNAAAQARQAAPQGPQVPQSTSDGAGAPAPPPKIDEVEPEVLEQLDSIMHDSILHPERAGTVLDNIPFDAVLAASQSRLRQAPAAHDKSDPFRMPPLWKVKDCLENTLHAPLDMMGTSKTQKFHNQLGDGGVAVTGKIVQAILPEFPQIYHFVLKPMSIINHLADPLKTRVYTITRYDYEGFGSVHAALVRHFIMPSDNDLLRDPRGDLMSLKNELIAIFFCHKYSGNPYTIHEWLFILREPYSTLCRMSRADVTRGGARITSHVTYAAQGLVSGRIGVSEEERRMLVGDDFKTKEDTENRLTALNTSPARRHRSEGTPDRATQAAANETPKTKDGMAPPLPIRSHWPDELKAIVASAPAEQERATSVAKRSGRCYKCGNKHTLATCPFPVHKFHEPLGGEVFLIGYLAERKLITPTTK